jgi:hypothetical protein
MEGFLHALITEITRQNPAVTAEDILSWQDVWTKETLNILGNSKAKVVLVVPAVPVQCFGIVHERTSPSPGTVPTFHSIYCELLTTFPHVAQVSPEKPGCDGHVAHMRPLQDADGDTYRVFVCFKDSRYTQVDNLRPAIITLPITTAGQCDLGYWMWWVTRGVKILDSSVQSRDMVVLPCANDDKLPSFATLYLPDITLIDHVNTDDTDKLAHTPWPTCLKTLWWIRSTAIWRTLPEICVSDTSLKPAIKFLSLAANHLCMPGMKFCGSGSFALVFLLPGGLLVRKLQPKEFVRDISLDIRAPEARIRTPAFFGTIYEDDTWVIYDQEAGNCTSRHPELAARIAFTKAAFDKSGGLVLTDTDATQNYSEVMLAGPHPQDAAFSFLYVDDGIFESPPLKTGHYWWNKYHGRDKTVDMATVDLDHSPYTTSSALMTWLMDVVAGSGSSPSSL